MTRLELLRRFREVYLYDKSFRKFWDCIDRLTDEEIKHLELSFPRYGTNDFILGYKFEGESYTGLDRFKSMMPKILESLRVPKPLKFHEIENNKPYWLFDGTKFYPQTGGIVAHLTETRALASVGFIYAGNLTRQEVEKAHAQNSKQDN